MNLKQLEVLKAVMASGSTVGASAILQLSQSAISRHLTALETDIGFELFIRDKGRLIPRPEARALVPEVEELTDVLERVKRKVTDLKSGLGSDTLLRVAFPHSMTTTVLPGVLARFLAERPRVLVEVLAGPYGSIEQMVQARRTDLGFVRLPTEDQGFDIRPVLRGNIACVMAKDHLLARKDVVTLEDLAGTDLILLRRQRSGRHELEDELRASRVPYRCRIEVHSVEAACACAASGLGIAIVPGLIASSFHSLPIALRPFRPAHPSDYGIATLPGMPLSRTADAFIAMFTDEVLMRAFETTRITDDRDAPDFPSLDPTATD
ncbi:LysR family transcriptional regulator [Microvirga brassicacearum]|uniref:LysR family transcriptional regulator n=1 Tax=Microvirga brassicacearum TaxID=2580413 RepID=A0A5N3P3W8_9HYPH|nr:LysR family transcriptional regulator [Microvirga brassicacearum]KAB0264425.1 LysR family transcriptional regulator [Microvirga brassicacearum]